MSKPTPDGSTPRSDERGLSPSAQAMRRAQPYIDAVWRFVGATGVAVTAGIFLDRWLHTLPLFTLVLLMVGLSAGFYGMYRSIARAGAASRPDSPKGPDGPTAPK